MFTRSNSKKAQLSKRIVDRTDSSGEISRGFVLPPSSLATVTSPPASSGIEVVEEVQEEQQPQAVASKKDEVAIVVGSRKNSMTKAVRYFIIIFTYLFISIKKLLLSGAILRNISATKLQCGEPAMKKSTMESEVQHCHIYSKGHY